MRARSRTEAARPETGTREWLPISAVHSQQAVLVCNHAYLGWWAVAIQNVLGEWYEAGSRYECPLKYEPTHYQELPSIYPLQALFAKRPAAVQ